MIEIRPVESRKERDRFIDLVWSLYRSDPAWVPPLRMQFVDHITKGKNPFLDHADVQFFNAYRNGVHVGRISAHIDYEHQRRYSDQLGFFGFFDCVDEPEVGHALLRRAEEWLRGRGMSRVRGPLSFSINHPCGVLVDGMEHPPYVEMAHSLPHIAGHIETAGYEKAMDLYAWRYDVSKPVPEICVQISDAVKEVPGLRVRTVDMKHWKRDLRIIMEIFNEAWSRNWGFVPLTSAEIEHLANELRLIIDPRLAFIAEVDGEPAAIAITIPNVNQVVKRTDGRTTPATLGRILWDLKVRRNFDQARLMVLGVRPKFRGSVLGGLSVHLYVLTHQVGASIGFREAELGWTLENNAKINNGIELMGGVRYKTYRLYERAL